MRILSLSDTIISFIHSPMIRSRQKEVDVILGCGDLPYYYLEYVFDSLEAPLYYVHGNHDKVVEYSSAGQRTGPRGGINLHRRTARTNGLLLAGVEGSLRYRPGPFQYSQAQMWMSVYGLAPALLRNRILYGRFLDVFISHAPPAGVHDADDLPHQGIKAFRWLINVFQPKAFIHGHIHIYYPGQEIETRLGATRVINTYGWRETTIDI